VVLRWGGGRGSIIPAIEQRIRAIILIGAVFYYWNPPDYNPINLAPRITAPVLIQNGRYDFFVSTEREIQPLLRIFGTPERDKALKLYEAGHAVWLRMEQQKDEIDFLDKCFGPVK
jgi:pimeloyl-ACP methyl ester carboxylesterase